MSLRLSLGQAWRASRHLCASRPLRSVCGPFAGFNEVATRWNSGGPELDSDQALPSLFKLSSAVVQPKQKLVVPDIDDGVSPTPSEPLPKDALQTELRLNSPPLSDSKPDMVQPQLIFDAAWRKLVHKFGIENLVFPKEIIFLAGAPGSGKGTMARYIVEARDLPGVIETSALFEGEKAEQIKREGKLIGDREVIEAVLEALLDKLFTEGAGCLVDGFPRTMIQAQVIKLLHDKMNLIRAEYKDDPKLRDRFRRPIFRLAVLYVEEEESVRRQLHRGEMIKKHNAAVLESKYGSLKPLRATDVSEELARERYRVFKKNVYEALQAIKSQFHFHFIPADGPPEEVRERIIEEFVYQSSLELDNATYQLVRALPSASHIVRHARQHMVQRLNVYARNHSALFSDVLHLIETDFVHILRRQSLAGKAVIRSASKTLDDPLAVNMVLDVLSERGFFVTLDVQKVSVPAFLHPAKPDSGGVQEIECKITNIWNFTIKFPRPLIRRGH